MIQLLPLEFNNGLSLVVLELLILRKERNGYTICFISRQNFCSKYFSLTSIYSDSRCRRQEKGAEAFIQIVRYYRTTSTGLGVREEILEKIVYVKFYENPFGESRVLTSVRTDERSDFTNKVSSNTQHI